MNHITKTRAITVGMLSIAAALLIAAAGINMQTAAADYGRDPNSNNTKVI